MRRRIFTDRLIVVRYILAASWHTTILLVFQYRLCIADYLLWRVRKVLIVQMTVAAMGGTHWLSVGCG